MRKLFKEVREIKRKMSLPIKREGSRRIIVRPKFTEREKSLLIEMLTRRSRRENGGKMGESTHIFAPMKMNKHE
jgi:hypothetical protein